MVVDLRCVQRQLTEREREQAAWRLRLSPPTSVTSADRQLVVEAVVEDEAVKTAIFAELDKVVTDPERRARVEHLLHPDHEAGMATQNAARVVGMHFFNPVRSFPGRTGDDAG